MVTLKIIGDYSLEIYYAKYKMSYIDNKFFVVKECVTNGWSLNSFNYHLN